MLVSPKDCRQSKHGPHIHHRSLFLHNFSCCCKISFTHHSISHILSLFPQLLTPSPTCIPQYYFYYLKFLENAPKYWTSKSPGSPVHLHTTPAETLSLYSTCSSRWFINKVLKRYYANVSIPNCQKEGQACFFCGVAFVKRKRGFKRRFQWNDRPQHPVYVWQLRGFSEEGLCCGSQEREA